MEIWSKFLDGYLSHTLFLSIKKVEGRINFVPLLKFYVHYSKGHTWITSNTCSLSSQLYWRYILLWSSRRRKLVFSSCWPKIKFLFPENCLIFVSKAIRVPQIQMMSRGETKEEKHVIARKDNFFFQNFTGFLRFHLESHWNDKTLNKEIPFWS